ncbi:MAG: hypothetical protein VW934_04500, partial [Alphaproteobacteria bacterium]
PLLVFYVPSWGGTISLKRTQYQRLMGSFIRFRMQSDWRAQRGLFLLPEPAYLGLLFWHCILALFRGIVVSCPALSGDTTHE